MTSNSPFRRCFPSTRTARVALPIALLTLLSVVGCKKESARPNRKYVFVFTNETVPVGATLMLGERSLGHVELHRKFDPGQRDDYRVFFYLSKSERLGSIDGLQLRVATPCGPVTREVASSDKHSYYRTPFSAAREEKRIEKYPDFDLNIPVEMVGDQALPPFTKTIVYTDFEPGDDRVLKIGKMVVPTRHRSHLRDPSAPRYVRQPEHNLFNLGCAPTHEVTIGGKPVGTIDSKNVARALLISADPGACYKASSLSYSSIKNSASGMGSTARRLPKAQVIALPFEKVDYFLKKAPSTTRNKTWLTEVVRTPCR